MADVNLVLLVERLVDRMVTRHAQDEQQAKNRSNVSLRLAIRILGARMGATADLDEAATLDALNRDASSYSADTTAPLRLLELHGRLATRMVDPSARTALLTTLLHIARDRRKQRGNAPNPYASLAAPFSTGLGLTSLRAAPHTSRTDPLRSSTSSLSSSGALHDPPLGASFGAHSSASLALALPPSTPPVRPWSRIALQRVALESVSESLLVRDVIHACQGIDGQYIRYDTKHDAYLIHVDEGSGSVPPTVHALIEQLTTLGCLYKRVRGHVSLMMSAMQHEGGKVGAVQQSLVNVLHRELAEYQRFIAILEQQSIHPIPEPEEGGEGMEGAASRPYLTLRRLAAWLDEPTSRMKTLAVITAVASGGGGKREALRGGALVRAVDAIGRDGDPAVQSLVSRIVQQMSDPVLTMTREWLTKGELMDPYHEFYIARGEGDGDVAALRSTLVTLTRTSANDSSSASRAASLWHHGYQIRDDMLPPFLTMNLAREILRCGRTIHFLHMYCSEDEGGGAKGSRDDPAAVDEDRALSRLQQLFASPPAPGTGGTHTARLQQLTASLEQLIHAMAARLDARLTHLLLTRHQLLDHLGGIKKYLLLSQGDFVRTLIESARDDLSSPARDLTEFRLQGALASALRLSNAQFDPPAVLSSLGIRLLPSAGAESGWDVLQITYDPTPALSPLLSPPVLLRYGRLFHLLWRIKRIEFVLSENWADFKPNGRCLRLRLGNDVDAMGNIVRQAIVSTLRRYHVARGEMQHFLTGLQSYVSIDVVDGGWEALCRQVASSRNLDEMIEMHEQGLLTMLRRALLDDNYASLYQKLSSVLDTILEFAGNAARLKEYVAELLLTLGNRRESSVASEVQGTWNRQQEWGAREVERMVDELGGWQARVEDVQGRYRGNLEVFCETLSTRYDVTAWGLLERLQRA